MSGISSVQRKLQWASRHIDDFERQMEIFRVANADCVVEERNGDLPESVYRVRTVPAVPDALLLTFGDALQNLRSSLDHLVFELVRVAGGKPTGNTAFPIHESADDYWEQFARKVKGMRQSAIAKINLLQPYKGGFGGQLYLLHRLNNIDKHRAVLAAAAFVQSRVVTSVTGETWSQSGFIWHEAAAPLKVGDVLHISKAQEHQETRFSLGIAIYEPGVVTGHSAQHLLAELRSAVAIIIRDMGPELV